MENNLMVKEVNFNGANLIAIKPKDKDEIYTGITYVLKGIGFEDRQIEYQRQKWNEDKIISKGVQKFSYPSINGGIQETYCISIKRLPLALAKINITPKIEKENPNLTNNLENYQENCTEILANAFIEKTNTALESYLDMDEEDRAIAYFKKSKENKKLVAEIKVLTPLAELAKKRIDRTGTVSLTDMTKTYSLKRGQISTWAKMQGYIHKSIAEVNKVGEQYFKVVGEDFKGVAILEEGIKLIDENIEQIRNSPTSYKKRNNTY